MKLFAIRHELSFLHSILKLKRSQPYIILIGLVCGNCLSSDSPDLLVFSFIATLERYEKLRQSDLDHPP